jgi:murein DD-endopeptidase MepM/ murein hydrolase activator NlpD
MITLESITSCWGKKFTEIDFLTTKVTKDTKPFPYFTYSPFGEDRKPIWPGTYLTDLPEAIHLGRDIQLPAGTLIYAPVGASHGIVMDIWDDTDLNVGWGRRIDILDPSNNRYWIIGHLDRAMESDVKVGQEVSDLTIIGQVGSLLFNGYTFPHIHLQTCDFKHVIKTDPRKIDGYGTKADLEIFDDPFKFLHP